jgi:hypothetical protein
MRVWSVRAAEAGADLVVGHGPHVPASLTWHEVSDRRVPILHSLGNLLAAMQAEEHAERGRAPHVRDSVVVTLRVSLERGRVRIDPPRVSAFWIDDVRSPSGAAPFTRPVAIDARRTDALGGRARRLAALFEGEPAPVIEGEPAPVRGSHDTVLTAAAGAPPSPPPTSARVALATPSPAATTPTTPPTASSPTTAASRPGTAAPSAPSPAGLASSRTQPAATTVAVAPVSASASGASSTTGARDRAPASALGVSFRCGSATETAIDDAALRAWVTRMQADRSLELEVVSTRCEGEPASLAERRARRAAGLLAVRGPSRSRFHWRPGPITPGAPTITAVAR